MKAYHWVALVVLFAIGYFVGTKWPSVGTKIIGSVPSVST
jgi:Ni,Fe-hydrogenase I cytochrome b subunit